MEKQNDYFINQLYNPTFLAGDFQNVGLNAANTSISNRDTYKKLDVVQNNDLFKTNGSFDENKFNQFYDKALLGFNQLSGNGHAERLATSYSAFRTDIFAKSSLNRTTGPETFITKIANPEGTSLGFVNRNIKGVQKLSARENAEAHLFYDGATNSWKEAPNDTPFNNFFNPKVLAQYDEDVDINGKTRGQVGFDANNIQYHKGDKKINPITGEYYYESLNGRNIYGREVLSGWDTLTVDGSTFNKYDFFDSDDIEKSPEGSLLKAAVKVAPALIPVISPWYIAARLALSTADLAAKVGKMLPGVSSNNTILSYLEGLNAAWTESTSDAASQHAWKLENILNLGADVFTQLAEQRWIFKYSAALKNGKLGYDKKAQEKFVKDLEKKYYSQLQEDINTQQDIFQLPAIAKYNAQAELEKRLKSTEKLSEHLSKLYMTGITAADSFGEAKEAGLSDAEAAIFTLVYGLGEYGILSTNLGEHILPELRADKVRWQNIAKTISGFKEETKDTRKFYQKIADFAKQTVAGDYNDSKIAKALKAGNTKTAFALSMASNALGEGLEEVSEEAWLDLAKGLYNAAADLHMTSTGATFQQSGGLEEILNRYAMNFVGGLIGGGIAVGLPGFQDGIKNMLGANMDTKQAYQELVALIRNGQMDDFLKVAKKLELADSTKSARNYEIVGDKIIYNQGTETDNQNKATQDILEHTVKMINNLLTTNGLNIDDSSILRHLTEDGRRLLQFHRILGNEAVGSSILASYVQDYNTLATQITSTALQLDALQNPAVDQEGKKQAITAENQQKITTLQQKLNKLLEQRDMYLNGEMTKYALPAAIFEMSDFISSPYLSTNFKQYIEKVEGKPLEELTPERVAELKEQWKWYKETQLSDDIRTAHGYFQEIQKRFSANLKEFNNLYLKPQNTFGNLGTIFQQTEQGILNTPGQIAEDIQSNAQSYEADSINKKVPSNSKINGTIKAIRSLVTALQEVNPDDVTLQGIQDKLNFLNLPATMKELDLDQQLLVLKLAKTVNPDLNALSDPIFNTLRELQNTDLANVSQETVLRLLKQINPKANELNQENIDLLNNLKASLGTQPLPDDINNLSSEQQINLLGLIRQINPELQALSDDNLNTLKDKFFKESIISTFAKINPETDEVSFREEIKQIIQDLPYMSQDLKDFLNTDLITQLQQFLENDDTLSYETNEDLMNFLTTISMEINKLPTTPIEQLADQFMLSLGENRYKLSQLIKALQNQMRISVANDTIGEFGYSEDVADQIDNALQILSLLEAHVLASRTDGKNLGNLFGYNVVVNKLIPEMDLATIDKNTANIIMQDIAKLRQKLLYYQGIFKVNSGQKLSEQSKINIRLKTAFVKRLKTLVSALPDDWEKQDEDGTLLLSNLKSLLEKCSTINGVLDSQEGNKYQLDLEKTKVFEKEYLDISNAIYELFNQKENLKRIQEGKLDEILDQLTLLPSTTGTSTTFDGTNIDVNLETIDDRSFLWMLITNASVKTSDFYAEYIKSINNQYAPIPGQELAIKMGYSFLLNRPMFQAFGNAYNKKFLKELETIDSDQLFIKYGKGAFKDSKLDSDYALQMMNTFLVEGIPGAGKSTGYYSVLIDMLKQNHKEFLKNVWVIHTDATKAAKFAESIGLEAANVTALDKNQYLKKICPEHQQPTVKNGVISLSVNELQTDPETNLKHYKNETLSQDSNIPTLIIMDESTRFSQQDFLLSEKYQQEHGVASLATGDYDQLGAFGSTKIDNETSLAFKTSSDNFVHSPKLGTSMRTDNKIKDTNIQILRSQRLSTINALTNKDTPQPLQLNYYESDEGLWGEKVVQSTSEQEIIKLLNTLKDDEQLLYVYYNEDSEVYKIIDKLSKEEEYKSKIVKKSSTDAQGDEAKYAIIETLPLEQNKQRDDYELVYSSLYTGITRSSQGTLIVNTGKTNLIQTTKVRQLAKSPLSKQAIQQYATTRKELLQGLLTGDEKPTVIVGKKPNTPPPGPQPGPVVEGSDIPTPDTGSSTTEEEADALNNDRVIKVENGDNAQYNMLLHSMPISETGFESDSSGLVASESSKDRIDSLNGLIKLGKYREPGLTDLSLANDGKHLNDERNALKILTELTQLCLYEKDPDKIKAGFARILNLRSDVDFGINFGYMSWGERSDDLDSKDPKYKRFFRGLKEKLYGVFTGTKYKDKDLAAQRHGIVANLYIREKLANGKVNRRIVTTLPLSIFTSPLTMLDTKGFERFKLLFNTMTGDLGHRMQSFKDLLSDEAEFNNRISRQPGITQEEIKVAKANRVKLLKHFILYTSWQDQIVLFPDDFVFAQQFQPLGPNITTKDKGNEYEQPSEMFVWKGEYMNLKDVDTSIHHISKHVYYTTEDVVINGRVVVKAGHGFVLCSDTEEIGNEQTLLEKFVERELKDEPEGRISLLYTSSPGVSIDEYLYNFAQKYIKDGQINKDFGNYLTDIKLASAITKDDSEFSRLMESDLKKDIPGGKTIDDLDPKDEVRLKIERWSTFKAIMRKVEADLEGKSFEEQKKLLSSKMSDEYLSILDPALKGSYNTDKRTLKSFIQNQIVSYVLKPRIMNKLSDVVGDGQLIITQELKPRLEAITKDTSEIFKNGIYVNLTGLGSDASINVSKNNVAVTFIPVRHNSKYEIEVNGAFKPIRINGKIDTTMHYGDVSSLMDYILNGIDKFDGLNKKRYFGDWIESSKVVEDEGTLLFNTLKDNFDDNSQDILKSLCKNYTKELIANLDQNNPLRLFDFFTSHNYYVSIDSINGRFHLRKDNSGNPFYQEFVMGKNDKPGVLVLKNNIIYLNTSSELVKLSKEDAQNYIDSAKNQQIKDALQEIINVKEQGTGGNTGGTFDFDNNNLNDDGQIEAFIQYLKNFILEIDGNKQSLYDALLNAEIPWTEEELHNKQDIMDGLADSLGIIISKESGSNVKELEELQTWANSLSC